jgi:hypothetical protein
MGGSTQHYKCTKHGGIKERLTFGIGFIDESAAVSNIKIKAPDGDRIGQNIQCISDLKFGVNYKILTQVTCKKTT